MQPLACMPELPQLLFYHLRGKRRFLATISLFSTAEVITQGNPEFHPPLSVPAWAVQNLSSSESLPVRTTITIRHAGEMELIRRLSLRQEPRL
jgi:hypothetical protein